jgi:hypothetical protein
MYYLIVTRIGLSLLTNNGVVTAGPETTITSMSSLQACQVAANAVTARAVATYRVFADCVAS